VDIEHRILNGVMFIGFLTGVLSTAENLLLDAPAHMTAPTAAATLTGLIGYLSARHNQRWRIFAVPVFLLFLSLLTYCWVTQAGSHGTIAYYFFLLTFCSIILFRGRGRLAGIAVLSVTIAGLLLLEYLSPERILPYPAHSYALWTWLLRFPFVS
jgi:hypothetical protein